MSFCTAALQIQLSGMQASHDVAASNALLDTFSRMQSLVQRCLEGEALVTTAWMAYQLTNYMLTRLNDDTNKRRQLVPRESRVMTPTELSRNRSRDASPRSNLHAVFEDTTGSTWAPMQPRAPPPRRPARNASMGASARAGLGGSARRGHGGAGGQSHVVFDAPTAVDRFLDLQRVVRAVVDNVKL